ncbi:MAG: hypothetical protein EBW14_18610 [Oxalobacteraceae bacterium]|nr:hypothetical protein [Oxalobacteraceae bacterium]
MQVMMISGALSGLGGATLIGIAFDDEPRLAVNS